MIIYILKSASCLALVLFFYHFVLEKEKMHHFNRYYLLIGVLCSFLAPLVTFTTYIKQAVFVPVEISTAPFIVDDIATVVEETPFNYTQLLIGLYFFVASIFLLRFGLNLFKIIKKIRGNKKVHHLKAIVVLVEDHILPHTFWNYIFINKTAYEKGTIEEELFTHELTHVTQKHTFDVLFIELLQAVFWINPLFIFLKKAIQLNHEFLADETVINTHKNTLQYQHLLLNKAAWNNEYYLASNLNYSLTKKRLKMMTTQSSKTIIWLKKLAVMPLLASFIFLFAERVEAQEKQEIIETIYEQTDNQEKISESEIYKKYYYKNLTIQRKDKNGKYLIKKYNELNDEEKSRLMPPPPLKLKKVLPTKAEFEALKDNSKFAVWIDGKVVDNKVLNNYEYTDFARYFNSHVYKNARSKRFPQENQASLETHAHFEGENNKRVEDFHNYLKEEHNIIEIIEETPKKKEFIDSPIPTNKSSKQFVPKKLKFKTEEIIKLKDINALKISYLKDTIPQKTSATKAQMKEYALIVAKRKRTDIFKVKEINKLKNIYALMSSEQKKSVINVNDFIKTIPILPPKPDYVYTYNRLANKVKRTSNNRKANLIYLNEIYKNKMNAQQRTKVTAPDKIIVEEVIIETVPIKPSKNASNEIEEVIIEEIEEIIEEFPKNTDFTIIIEKNKNDENTSFYLDDKKITREELFQLDPKKIKSMNVTRNNEQKKVYLTSLKRN